MLAVGLSEEEARAHAARHDRTVSIAAFNGPRSLTLSGPQVVARGDAGGTGAQGRLRPVCRVDHPFHHAMMQPAADALAAELADLAPQAESVPFFSTVTGRRCAGKDCTAAHWGRGIRQAVQFVPAVNALADFGVDVWLEISCASRAFHLDPGMPRRPRTESRRSPPRPGASASMMPSSKRPSTCTGPGWRLISPR